ncbi:MAG: peptidoglycan-associated lipoprotein [Alphaproteobacteria bacterium]|nr:peptidoglycan-associated lipoprotein [Alphaproteobacteria bacterium]
MFTRTSSAKLASLSLVLFIVAACSGEKMMPPPAAMPPPPPPAAAPPPPPPPPPPPARPPAPVQQSIVPGSLQDFQVNVGDRVFFAYDKSDLDDRARGVLQKQAAWLQRFGAVILILEGHADERGTREYNLALGARRAQTVKDYLASLGVSGARLETISYGKERPVCVESNDGCWAQNRRGVSTIKSGAVS